MRTSKSYEELPTYYYRPEMRACLECGSKLKRSHTAWQKTITTLAGSGRVYNQGYRCSRGEGCYGEGRVYRSA